MMLDDIKVLVGFVPEFTQMYRYMEHSTGT